MTITVQANSVILGKISSHLWGSACLSVAMVGREESGLNDLLSNMNVLGF